MLGEVRLEVRVLGRRPPDRRSASDTTSFTRRESSVRMTSCSSAGEVAPGYRCEKRVGFGRSLIT